MGVSEVDEVKKLEGLGYAQVLKRGWGRFTNIAVTISAMAVLMSIYSTFKTGLVNGGPVVCLWAWIWVALGNICIALGMAELASAYPTSGGMYFWIHQLSNDTWGPGLCWVTGWLNLLGQIASLASSSSIITNILSDITLLSTGTAYCCNAPPELPSTPPLAPLAPPMAPGTTADYVALPTGPGRHFTMQQSYAIFVGCIFITTLINTLPYKYVHWITEAGGYWNILGVIIVIIVIPAVATQHASADWVFRSFETAQAESASGITDKFNIFIMGLLLPSYSFIGYDGAAHMAEESLNASMSAPQGILLGVGFMAIFGWLWNLSLLFCVNDYLYVLDYESGVSSEAGGSVVAQIFYDAFKQREGSGTGGIVFLLIPLIGAFFCGISNLTYVARIMFCYARDGAVPLSHMWTVYNETTQSPLYAVWVTGLLAALIGLPMLGSTVAFNAIISLSTVALNVAYIIPNLARITWGRKRFVPGPFNLGIWAYPINAIGTVWVIFILVVFSLPTVHPVTGENLNYAGIMLLGTAIVSLLWYGTPYIGAYRWFKGPVRTFTPLETLPSLDLSTKSKQMPLMTYSKDLSAGGIGTEEGDTAYKGNKFVSPEIN